MPAHAAGITLSCRTRGHRVGNAGKVSAGHDDGWGFGMARSILKRLKQVFSSAGASDGSTVCGERPARRACGANGHTRHGATRNTARNAACNTTRGARRGGQGGLQRGLSVVLAVLLVGTLVPALPGLSVRAADATPAAVPQFTLQPTDSTYSENAATRFYVRAASTDSGYLSYQWHRSRTYAEPVANAATDPAVQEAIKKTSTAFANGIDTTQAVLSDTTPAVDAATYLYYWVTVTNNKDSNEDGDMDDPGEQNAKDSALACVKVVDRKLSPELVLGTFEDRAKTNNVRAILEYWPRDRYPYSWNSTANEFKVGAGDARPVIPANPGADIIGGAGKVFDIQPHSTWRTGLTGGDRGSYSIEIAPFRSASAYQEIATVPGKIYEWSFDHAARGSKNTDVMALIIGPAINEKSDYGTYVSGEPNYWNTLNASTNPTDFVAPYPEDGDYPYGVNNQMDPVTQDTYFLAICNQLMNEKGLTVSALTTLANSNKMFSTTYYGKEYYVYFASTHYNQAWQTKSGAYTVPAGQGTTVYAWLDLTQHDGNIVDNVVFASGTDFDATQALAYTGETSLSAPTKEGFAYALAELRGSSVNELVGLSASYNGAAIAPTEGLGSGGWYTTDSNTGTGGTPFTNDGTITFKDLVPSKTYRIIGIPVLAINTGLQTNVGPGNVLDQGYYRDVRIGAAAGGDASTLPAWDLELYDDAGTQRARLILKNTNAAVQYALLAGSATAPDTSAPALPSTAWRTGTSGDVAFEGLGFASTYWLVSRPQGYSEIGYADAAWGDGELVAIKITTPNVGSTDIAAASVAREPGGTTVTIAAAGTRQGYEYALAEPTSGHIVVGPLPYTGGAIRFESLDSAASYQVVCRSSGGDWLQGVRVLPYANVRAPLAVDFAGESVKNTAASAGVNGFIPVDIEFAVRAEDGAGTGGAGTGGAGTWIVGSEESWARSTGTERLELGEPGVVNDGVVGDGSILGALSALVTDGATLSYRLRVGGSYAGAVVAPVLTLRIPARPAIPRGNAFDVDYEAERITAGGTALEWRSPSATGYAALGAGAQVGFAALGWNGAVAREVSLRFPATGTAFASWPRPLEIPVRRAAPEGLTVALVDAAQPALGITINNLEVGTAYQYSRDKGGTWTDFVADVPTKVLPYDNTGGDYEIRFPATGNLPASFYTTVSSPLNISALNLGTVTYGAVGDRKGAVTINNISAAAITLASTAITLSGTGSEHFALNSPGEVTVPAASGSVGQNSSWVVTPKPNIPAGNYLIEVNIAYTHDGKGYNSSANVYLTVNKADWNLGQLACTVDAASVTQSGFTVRATGAPQGARLAWALGGGAFSAPDAAVAAGGATQHSFGGLAAASAYPVRVRATGDANHNEVSTTALVTGYTAQATPDVLSVIHIDYANETLAFNTGFAPTSYLVTIEGAGGAGTAELSNLASLSAFAEAGFTLRVVRRAEGPVAASAPASLAVEGKRAAPTAPSQVSTTSATDDRTADGTITLAGSFQYRASRNGADVTAGWMSASGSAKVTAGRYEVRFQPTATAFASKIVQVRVLSAKPSVTLHTKTYVPTGGSGAQAVLPGYISLPAGWDLSTDPARPGEYERAYLSSPLALPGVPAVTSTSHVFAGWYGNEGLTGGPVTQTPVDNPLVGHEYWAKWVARPTLSTVGGVAPVAEAASASRGLDAEHPVRLEVRLPSGKGTLALSELAFLGQASGSGRAPKMYASPNFSSEAQSLTLAWTNDASYPTHAYVKAVSVDDSTTTVYYDLTLYTTRAVTYTATQTGGAAGIKTTTGIDLVFSEPVTGLSAASITVATSGDSGRAVKGALTAVGDTGKNYRLAVSGVASGRVNVSINSWAGYSVPGAAQQVSVYRDNTPPTGTITIRGNAFAEFLSDISFRLFFRESTSVTIAAADTGGDGVASREYLKRSAATAEGTVTGFASAEAAKAATGWTAYTVPLSVSPNEKFVIYARITDRAGNVSVIDSAGVVVYTESAVAAGSSTDLSYTKLSRTDVSTTLALNGNLVKGVVLKGSGGGLGDLPLVKGTDYTIATDGTLTLKGAWLEARAAGDYTLEVSYLPLGADPSNAAGANNQLPATSTLSLVVQKVQPGIALTADPVPALGASYGTDNLTLRAIITDPGAGTPGRAAPGGTVSFYKNSVEVKNLLGSAAPVEDSPDVGSGQRRARLTLTLDAGTYKLYAVYSGDGNFAGGNAPAIMSYTVRPAAQGALVVHEGSSTGPAVSILAKKREDRSITLTVTGGAEAAGGFVWASNDTDVATVSASGAKGETATVTLKAKGGTVLSVYRAATSNYAQSARFDLPLSVAEETTPPVPGGGAVEGTAAVRATMPNDPAAARASVQLGWDRATDNNTFTTDADLSYYVYRSTSAANNITTPAECEANGTLLNTGDSKDINGYTAEGLAPNTAYWFNVVVADEAGNRAAYSAVRAVTHLEVRVESVAQQRGGKNGRERSTGVLITFDEAVTGLSSAAVTVGGGAQKNGPVTDAGDNNGATWLVPIALDTGTANGTPVTVTVASWANNQPGADGHGYDVATGHGTASATVYAPSPWEQPAASIDYVNEQITGLVVGGVYTFSAGGPEHTIGTAGTYPVPFDEITDSTVSIMRVGTGAGVSLDDDDPGRTDSSAQALAVPARPDAPEGFGVVQPTAGTPTGSLTGLDTAWEYRAGGSVAYTPITAETISGLAPGPYYLRVAAVAGEGFASGTAYVYIHQYGALNMGDALEGYDGSEAGAYQTTVIGDAGTTITGVEWIDGNGVTAAEAEGLFTLAGSDSVWTVTPKTGLAAKGCLPTDYRAKIRITYEASGASEQDVLLTVHPRAQFAMVDGAAASSVDTKGTPNPEDDVVVPGGLTNTLTLSFAYPINLAYKDVTVGGAAYKSPVAGNGIPTFRSVSPDKKTYVLNITASPSHKSGDAISVTVKIHDDTQHAFQVSTTQALSITATTTVTIPRAIGSVRSITAMPGYDTGIIQFTLDKGLAPLTAPALFEWAPASSGETYDGPIVLGTSEGSPTPPATITGIYRVDADKTSVGGVDQYWTFRMLISDVTASTAVISIPSFGISTPVAVEGGLSEGDGLDAAAYFLDGDGYNYYTDLDACQVLADFDAVGGYVAGAYVLPTSLEWEEGMSAEVTVFKPDGSTVTLAKDGGAGPGADPAAGTYALSANTEQAVFRFTDTPNEPVTLEHQLILTLNKDWTRTEGVHRLAVVFKKDGGEAIAVQAVVNVLRITPTWRLAISDGEGVATGSGSAARSERGVPANTPTAAGDFEAGTAVTLVAGEANAAAGWRFSHWEQLAPITPAITLPTAATGDITLPAAVDMPAEGLRIHAHYTDGIAPETTCDRETGTWLKEGDTVTLTATDRDVTPTGGANDEGTVAGTWYRVDGSGQSQPYSAGVPFDFGAAVTAVAGADDAEGIHTLSFWSVDAAGNVEAAHEIELGFDKTAPTAALRLRGTEYAGFTGHDTGTPFTRFYRGDVQGEVLSGDAPAAPVTATSGVAKVEYLQSTVPHVSASAVLAVDTGWMEAGSFGITADWSGFVYARVTDHAGNVAVADTEGIVRYTDSVLPEPALSYVRASGVAPIALVTLSGNSIAALADVTGGGAGIPLEPGADYTVDDNSGEVTFALAWLQTLQSGDHALELRFSPGGEGYIATQGNDAPTPQPLTLTVSRAAPVAVTLAAVPVSPATYGDQVELTATVRGTAAAYVPGGTVRFYDGDEPLGLDVTLVAAPGGGDVGSAVATSRAVLSAGEHELRAEYSGDGNYLDATDTLPAYNVLQANQGTPTIHYGEGGATITSLDVAYGDAPFVLAAQGGEGEGSLVWSSSDSAVASVDAATGEVGLVSVGSCTISVRRLGDDNHNASPQAVLALTVSPREVTLTGIEVEDKVYDGTADATIIVPEPTSLWITGLVAGDEGAVSVPTDGITATFVAGADAGQDKAVVLSGFVLAGARADNYLLSAAPAPVTATIFKAVPTWADGADAPAASPLVFGQRLSASELTGRARGVDGSLLAGSLSWAGTVDSSEIPGSDTQSATNGLVPGGYGYDVAFTPADTVNYEVLEGVVTVPVALAMPQMASGGGGAPAGAPVGSTIFASGSPRPETLAHSTITGDVVFSFGGVATALAGTWSWDDEANGVPAASISYANAGTYHPVALFTPVDPRVVPLSVAADLIVFSPRTEIRELPAFGPAAYGARVGDVAIGQGGELGEVLAVAADDEIGAHEDITAQGSWEWKSPDVLLSSKLGSQQATLVFVPNVQADISSQSPTGYLKAEVTVTLSVAPASPSVRTAGDPPVLHFGQSLASASIAQAGYVFSGVVALGEDELEGVLAFDDATIVPGAPGYEADGLGSTVRESGRFVAQATFTPDAARYGSAYTPLTLNVELAVALSSDTQEALEDAAAVADAAHSVVAPGSPDAENYDPIDLARFEAARTALEDALVAAGGGGSGGAVLAQSAAEQLLAELEAALAALEHDHPVIVPVSEPITAFGVGVTIAVKGSFTSVVGVSLDGRAFALEPTASPITRSLLRDGQKAGTLSQGSAVITLEPAFVDTLPNGLHTLVLHFADDHASGTGTATFVIARDSSGDNGGGGTGDGGGGGGSGGGTGDGGGSGAGDGGGGDGGDGQGDGGSAGGGSVSGTGDSAGGTPTTGDADSLLLALIAAFFMILAAASFAVALTSRQSRKR